MALSNLKKEKDFYLRIFVTTPSLTNFEIQKYYQNELRFNGVYSRDDLSDKIKDGAYVINLDEYSDIGTQVTYFDSFGVEHIPKEIKKIVKGSSVTTYV